MSYLFSEQWIDKPHINVITASKIHLNEIMLIVPSEYFHYLLWIKRESNFVCEKIWMQYRADYCTLLQFDNLCEETVENEKSGEAR